MKSKAYHRIVRFIHYRGINILGWPTNRMRAIWWLYEFRSLEHWRKLADALADTHEAIQEWLAAVDSAEIRS